MRFPAEIETRSRTMKPVTRRVIPAGTNEVHTQGRVPCRVYSDRVLRQEVILQTMRKNECLNKQYPKQERLL